MSFDIVILELISIIQINIIIVFQMKQTLSIAKYISIQEKLILEICM